MMQPVWAQLDRLPEREVRPGVYLRILLGEKVMFSAVRFQPRSSVPTHQHPHEQMGIVLEGELELWIRDERVHVPRARRLPSPPGGLREALLSSGFPLLRCCVILGPIAMRQAG